MNIDRIAREMVDVEPCADLEGRIRARLDQMRPQRTAMWWSWRLAVPASAAAAIVIALIARDPVAKIERPGSVTSQAATVPASRIPVSSPPVQPTADAGVARVSPARVRRSAAARDQKPAEPGLSAEELAWMERRVPALDPLTAVTVDRLQVTAIQPEPLAITPLIMTPVGTESAGIERRHDR